MTPITTVEDLGRIARDARKAQGLTQTELADICNVSLSFIVNLEHGKKTAEIGKCLHVLRMLGIDLFTLNRGDAK